MGAVRLASVRSPLAALVTDPESGHSESGPGVPVVPRRAAAHGRVSSRRQVSEPIGFQLESKVATVTITAAS